MSSKEKRRRRGLALPLVLITIGLIFLLNNLGALHGDLKTVIFRLWPILLIIGGIDYLFRSRGVLGSVVMIGGGIVFLLGGFDLLGGRGSWHVVLRLWPVLVVAFGLEMLAGKRSLWATLICVIVSLLVMGGALWLGGVRILGDPPDSTLDTGLNPRASHLALYQPHPTAAHRTGSDAPPWVSALPAPVCGAAGSS